MDILSDSSSVMLPRMDSSIEIVDEHELLELINNTDNNTANHTILYQTELKLSSTVSDEDGDLAKFVLESIQDQNGNIVHPKKSDTLISKESPLDQVDEFLKLGPDDLTTGFDEDVLFAEVTIENTAIANDRLISSEDEGKEIKTTMTKAGRQKHVRDAKTKLFNCNYCSKAFQYVSRLERHLTAHRSKQFRCDVCDKFFSRNDVLQTHLERLHGRSKTDKKAESEGFPCNLCSSVLKSRHHLKRHLESHSNRIGNFNCDYCDKRFTEKHRFQRHLRQHIGQKRFRCDQCGMAFLQRQFLARHELTHTSEHPYKCDQCGRAFKQLVNLRQHCARLHPASPTGRKKPFMCEQCGKSFFSEPELRNHALYHKESRQFECSECGAKFVEKRHLDRHCRRVHSRIKNFFCQHCNASFYEKYELNFHLKTRKRCNVEK